MNGWTIGSNWMTIDGWIVTGWMDGLLMDGDSNWMNGWTIDGWG